MCGIAGFRSSETILDSQETLSQILETLHHRGPDGIGVWHDEAFSIGMTRLAIIDVDGGQQPISNESGDFVIVCNGEIYNHRELRLELEKRGHTFRTHSDVEVALHLFEEKGVASFRELNGMFALAILDRVRNQVTLARDGFGQKPLYVLNDKGAFAFASELKALRRLPGFQAQVDDRALTSYVCFRYVPHPHCILEGVEKLSPGSWLQADSSGKLERGRFFQADFSPGKPVGRDSDGDETYRVLRDAVERHLMSERPLGVYLSGGLDSSAIVALMSDLGVRDIRTYSVGCRGYGENEFENARTVADYFKTNHTEVELGPEDFVRTLAHTAAHADEPMADLTSILLHELSAVARRDVVVVLSGEGSDEFWAGYGGMEDIQRHFDRLRKTALLRPLARILCRIASGRCERVLSTISLTPAKYLAREVWNCSNALSSDEARRVFYRYPQNFDVNGELRKFYLQRPDWSGIDLMMGAQIEWWLPDDLLHKADRMSMANSIELRCPFLDLEFARHSANLRTSDKINFRDTRYTRKIALKKAFEHRLPAGIANQPKKGFPLAANGWLRDQLRGYMREQLLGQESSLPSNFDRSFLELIDRNAANGDAAAQTKAWMLIVLNAWTKHWLPAQRSATRTEFSVQ